MNVWSRHKDNIDMTTYLHTARVCITIPWYTAVLKCYKNEHSFQICHWAWCSKLSCKISRRYDQPFSRKWRLKLLFLVLFRIFPNKNCDFLPGLWKAGCDVARLYVLQSYRSCTFCKRETRVQTQFWIKLAALYTLANNNEMISDERLPFIMARIASGVNACCHRHVPYDVINKRLSALFGR